MNSMNCRMQASVSVPQPFSNSRLFRADFPPCMIRWDPVIGRRAGAARSGTLTFISLDYSRRSCSAASSDSRGHGSGSKQGAASGSSVNGCVKNNVASIVKRLVGSNSKGDQGKVLNSVEASSPPPLPSVSPAPTVGSRSDDRRQVEKRGSPPSSPHRQQQNSTQKQSWQYKTVR